MGKRYESKRGEVRDAREDGDRIKNDQETLKNEYSLLSSVESILGDIDDEVAESVIDVARVGEQEGTRLESEHRENDAEKEKIVGEIDEELEKLRNGMSTLESAKDNPFGKSSVEQAKKEYEEQAAKYRELIEELDIESSGISEGSKGNSIDGSSVGVSDIRRDSNIGLSDIPGNSSQHFTAITNSLISRNVSYNAISLFGRDRNSEEIVSRLGGGDQTQGSCSSLAFAYAGNRAGYDVLDFRDGDSREFFSSNASIQMISELPGVESLVLNGTDDFESSHQLFNTMEEGKEYYFATGLHAAVVRKNSGNIEYLELQHPYNNGWRSMNDESLEKRFGCIHNEDRPYPNFLISVDSLADSREFLDVLGYINTSENEQRKGINGYER